MGTRSTASASSAPATRYGQRRIRNADVAPMAASHTLVFPASLVNQGMLVGTASAACAGSAQNHLTNALRAIPTAAQNANSVAATWLRQSKELGSVHRANPAWLETKPTHDACQSQSRKIVKASPTARLLWTSARNVCSQRTSARRAATKNGAVTRKKTSVANVAAMERAVRLRRRTAKGILLPKVVRATT